MAVARRRQTGWTSIVNETVDVARIEPGRTRIRRRTLPVSEFIYATVNRMKSVFDGHSLDVRTPRRLVELSADPELAGVAIQQLLDNAAKYSPLQP